MSHTYRWTAVVAMVACSITVGGCKPKGVKASESHKPAHIEAIEGSPLHRVTLTSRASERLDIKLTQVEDMVMGGVTRKVVPYGAVLYDVNGDTWVYTSPDALVFVTVTSYSPYPPLEIGLSVRVVNAADRQTLASLDTTRYAEQDIPFSNGDCVVAHPAEDLLTTDAAIAHSSPREFVRYVSMHVAHALALDPLPLPPTATGLGLSILPKPRPSPESCAR